MITVREEKGYRIAILALAVLVVLAMVVIAVLLATRGDGKASSGASRPSSTVASLEPDVAQPSSADAGGGTVQVGTQEGSSGGQQGQSQGSSPKPAPDPSTDEQAVAALAMEYAMAPDSTAGWRVIDIRVFNDWARVVLIDDACPNDYLSVVFQKDAQGTWTNVAAGINLHHGDVPGAPWVLFSPN